MADVGKQIKEGRHVGLPLFDFRFFAVCHISSPAPPFPGFFPFLDLGGFRHISTENLALGSLRSDDWQLGRPTAPPRFVCLAVETLLVFFRAASSSGGDLRGCQGRRRRAAFILTLDSPASHFTIEPGTKRNAVQLSFVP
jgi:hypothetical protein